MEKYNVINGIKIEVPDNVKLIINILEKNGFEAFAVGGCVRDTILGRKPKDWDITTSALPHQIKEIFNKTIDTGIQHGTVTVLMKGVGYEVTTYRIDGEYNDSRHPESVEFTANLVEDLKRRDFTINAMAYNPKIGLVDEFDGIGDIEKKIIKCVGDAELRFGEDALRILRAVRFSAQLDFSIHEETMEAIKKLAKTLENISAERIQSELEKLIVSNHPEYLITAYNAGITKIVLPEFDKMMECEQKTKYHMYNVGVHTVKVMKNVPANKTMRWTALLHDVAKPEMVSYDKEKSGVTHFHGHAKAGCEMAKKIMRRLKMDNKTIKTAEKLIEHHDDRPTDKGFTQETIRRHINIVGKELYPLYLQLVYADLQGKSSYGKEYGMGGYLYTKEQYEAIIKENQCTEVAEMKISGNTLIKLGCPAGPIIGETLGKLLDDVLSEPSHNTKEYLENKAKQIINVL